MISNTVSWLLGYKAEEDTNKPVKELQPKRSLGVKQEKELVSWGSWLNDPQIFAINRNDAHTPLRSFTSVEQAGQVVLGNVGDYEGGWMKFSSEWRYSGFASFEDLPKQFMSTSFNDAAWEKVVVPHQQDANINPHFIPVRVYRYWFYISQDQLNKPASINFNGVGGALFIWINDQFQGYGEDGSVPQDFNLNGHLKEGYNLLVAVVSLESTGSVLDAKRKNRVYGIYGEVGLLLKPQVHIVDFVACPKMTFGSGASVSLVVNVELSSTSQELMEDVIVELQLLGADMQQVISIESTQIQVGMKDSNNNSNKNKQVDDDNGAIQHNDYIWVADAGAYFATSQFKIDLTDKGIKVWSAEDPVLYAAVIVLKDGQGNVVECEGCAVGFREIDIVKWELCVNGVPIVVKGIEYDPDVSSEEAMVRDLHLIKQHNFNTVMTSLPNTRWLELCNQIGLYVINVADLQTYNSQDQANKVNVPLNYLYPFMSRGVRMVHTNRNHPSIILWSLGYECGFSAAHSSLAGYISHIDHSRHLLYSGEGGTTTASDIICPQLFNVDQLLELVNNPSFNRPIIISKFFDEQGNTGGGFKELWELVWQYPMLQGGFFSLDSLTISEGKIHPLLTEAKALFKPVDFAWPVTTLKALDKDAKAAKFRYTFEIAVRNNCSLTPLNNIQILWRIAINGHVADFDGKFDLGGDADGWGETSKLEKPIVPGDFAYVSLPVKPLELLQEISKYGWRSIEVILELRAVISEATNIYPIGHVLGEHQLMIPHTYLDSAARYVMALAAFQDDLEDPHVTFTSKVSCAPLSVQESEDSWSVKGSGLEVQISKTNGGIVNLDYGELHGCVKGLQPCFVRMPTDQDRKEVNGTSYVKIWKDAGLDSLSIADEVLVKLLSASNDLVKLEVSYTIRKTEALPLSTLHGEEKDAAEEEAVKEEATADGQLPNDEVPQQRSGAKIGIKIMYHILHSGVILMECSFDTREALNLEVESILPESLPRVGLEFKLSKDMNQLQYYGRGPYENYPDRRCSSLLRRYNQSFEEMQVEYPNPQESGGRGDIRCVLLTNDNGQGVGVFDAAAYESRAFQMNVSDKTLSTLEGGFTKLGGYINLYLDHKHMGVGGTSQVSTKHCIPPDVYKFTIGLVPYIGLSTPDKAMEMLIGTWRQNMLRI